LKSLRGNTELIKHFFTVFAVLFSAAAVADEIPGELRVGRAGHAFDHLSAFGEQAKTAAASGATIIYASGLGGLGYGGLPPRNDFTVAREKVGEYNRRAKQNGIELAIGYLCATSMVKLDSFDKYWTDDFRAQFKTRPGEWRQQDRQGKPLASWYGGDYAPACMNNPDWRAYQRAMVRYQLEAGHDGIFFDNPTVHPQGCYCPHCLTKFTLFLTKENVHWKLTLTNGKYIDIDSFRSLPDSYPQEFLRFRATIARDFLSDMREFARTINPRTLITCNNSLNSSGVLYSQCRTYGYNIYEMSKAEDLVVVEDMATQPRTEASGQTLEYGPTYKQLHAISHGKPIVAVTIAGGDYHTAPHLMRLAMAEAAANNASYLSWPTWPEEQRQRMIAAVRPQADFLRRNEALLNDAPFRADVALFLPFRRWLETETCAASNLAAALTAANIQYKVVCEDDLESLVAKKQRPVLVLESMSVLTAAERAAVDKYQNEGPRVIAADRPDWLEQVRVATVKPSVRVQGPPTVRAIAHDQPGRTIVHLYNLNVQRISSFEDRITPANDVKLSVTVPFKVRAVNLQTADENTTSGPLEFTTRVEGSSTLVSTTVPRLDISAMITIEK
jgi:hypothetical protein